MTCRDAGNRGGAQARRQGLGSARGHKGHVFSIGLEPYLVRASENLAAVIQSLRGPPGHAVAHR